MQEVPFEKAQLNLRDHIKTNQFPPTIADIIRRDPEQYVDYERMKLETRQLLDEMDEWEQKAVPCPEHLRKRLPLAKECAGD